MNTSAIKNEQFRLTQSKHFSQSLQERHKLQKRIILYSLSLSKNNLFDDLYDIMFGSGEPLGSKMVWEGAQVPSNHFWISKAY